MSLKEKIKKNHLFMEMIQSIRKIYYGRLVSKERLIKRKFKKNLNKKVNLNNPVEFSEKLQWLKLYWHDSYATICADKYNVRNIVQQKIGNNYLNNIIEVFDSVNEIDLEKLPKSFVLKGTHGSGYNIVCKDKTLMNWSLEFKKMHKWLEDRYYITNGEWVYKNIKPRIICEEFLVDDNELDSLTDYKFYCFNGEPIYCQVIRERNSGGTIDFFDQEWNHMEFTGLQKLPNSKQIIPKPYKHKEMLNIASKLSKPFPFVRVDLYYVNNKVYFGELTFFPRSGFGQFHPLKWNEEIGNLLELPNSNRENKS